MFTTRVAKEIGFINRFYTKCSFFLLLKSNWILKSILIDAHYRFSKMSCILIFNLQFTSRLQTLVHWLKHEKIKRKHREKKTCEEITMRNIIHLEWRQRMKNPFISTGTWRIFFVSKVHAYLFILFRSPCVSPQSKILGEIGRSNNSSIFHFNFSDCNKN